MVNGLTYLSVKVRRREKKKEKEKEEKRKKFTKREQIFTKKRTSQNHTFTPSPLQSKR
jgi:hypothetical protein